MKIQNINKEEMKNFFLNKENMKIILEESKKFLEEGEIGLFLDLLEIINRRKEYFERLYKNNTKLYIDYIKDDYINKIKEN